MFRILIPALFLAGCAIHAHDEDNEVRVEVPPPPPPQVVLVKGTCPSPDHVWVDGHYNYVNESYVWVDPHWAVPPKGKRVWVKGYWRDGGWIGGRWR